MDLKMCFVDIPYSRGEFSETKCGVPVTTKGLCVTDIEEFVTCPICRNRLIEERERQERATRS